MALALIRLLIVYKDLIISTIVDQSSRHAVNESSIKTL